MATFETLSANSTTETFFYAANRGSTGLHFSAIGTFGGGTLQIQQQHSDGTFRNIQDGSFTADANSVFDIPSGTRVRAVLTGATSPSIFVEFCSMDGRSY